MDNSKLVRFLQALSVQDRKRFEQYVNCSLFNRRKSLINLLNFLNQCCRENNGFPTREETYAAVYGNNPYNERSLRTAMAQLFTLLRDFLAMDQFLKDDGSQQRFFISKLNELNLPDYFPGYHQKASRLVQESPAHSSDRHLQLMLLEEELILHQLNQPSRIQKGSHPNPAFHLQTSFLTRLLRYELRKLNNPGNFEDASQLGKEIIEVVARQLKSAPITVQAYSLLVSLHQNPDQEELWGEIRKTLQLPDARFSRPEEIELYTATLNYAARKLNSGQTEYLEELFEVYLEMLEKELIIQKEHLSAFHFKNMVNVALRLKKFDWTADFLDSWRNRIAPDHAQNAFHYNQGMFLFYQGKFAEAERHFNKVLQDYEDIFYGLNSRGFLLQIYYELGEIRSLESLAHSFRVLLGRSKDISTQTKDQYIAFIRHLSRLINAPLRDRNRLEKIRKDIQEGDRRGMGTVWLKEKIDDLLEAAR